MTTAQSELLITAIASFVASCSSVFGALVVLPPAASSSMHWSERARRTYPARVAPYISFILNMQVTVVLILILAPTFFPAPLPAEEIIKMACTAMAGPFIVAMFMGWLASPRRFPIGRWLIGCASALLLRFPNTVIYTVLALVMLVLPHSLPNVIVLLTFGGMLMVVNAFGGAMLLAKAIGLAREALPRTMGAANWAGERVGVRPSKVYELISQNVRVDAFVFSKLVIFTDSAAKLLTDEDLLSLCVRETTCFQQPRLQAFLRIYDSTMSFMLLACTAIGAVTGGHTLLVGVGVLWLSILIIRPFYLKAQRKADALAAAMALGPTASLQTLEKMYELNLQPVVAVNPRSADAHLYDRLVAAGIVPTYPRPRPPSKGRIALSILTTVISGILFSLVLAIAVYAIFHE